MFGNMIVIDYICRCTHKPRHSLVMPNGDSWDGFFYPTFTLMRDSYIIVNVCNYRVIN